MTCYGNMVVLFQSIGVCDGCSDRFPSYPFASSWEGTSTVRKIGVQTRFAHGICVSNIKLNQAQTSGFDELTMAGLYRIPVNALGVALTPRDAQWYRPTPALPVLKWQTKSPTCPEG